MTRLDDLRQADLLQIVSAIYEDWDDVDPYADQYLRALDLHDCRALGDRVGNETAELQIRYFLANAGGWHGPVARAVKAELWRRLRAAR